MQVQLQSGDTPLAELVKLLQSGEEVIIADGDTPVAKLVPYQKKGAFKLGILAGLDVGAIPDFLEPMSEEELRLWEGK